jgi:hypothetical protein
VSVFSRKGQLDRVKAEKDLATKEKSRIRDAFEIAITAVIIIIVVVGAMLLLGVDPWALNSGIRY